jgi:transposase
LLDTRAGGFAAADNRLFVKALLYSYRASIPWDDSPERFGDWKNACRWSTHCAETGVLVLVLRYLGAGADSEYAMIDNYIVRVHKHGAGAIKPARTNRPASPAAG